MIDEDKLYNAYSSEEENGKKKAGPPRVSDWKNADRFVKFLKTFYDVTLKFSVSLSVTSNLCFNEVCKVNSSLALLA